MDQAAIKEFHNKTISQLIAAGMERGQPYLNLVNQKRELSEIFSDEHLAAYKQAKLKSLYFRTGKLELNDYLAVKINQLAKGGIREVFVFYGAESELTEDDFKQFLRDYKISINLEMVPMSELDEALIRSTKFGERDLLAFSDLKDYRLIYVQNPYDRSLVTGEQLQEPIAVLPMLNSIESDQIVEENYQEKRDVELKQFEYEAPKYITVSQGWTRVTKTEVGLHRPELEISMQVSAQAQVSVTVDRSMEAEEEVSVDQAQLDGALSDISAMAAHIAKVYSHLFLDSYITACPAQKPIEGGWYLGLVTPLMEANPKIRKISLEALETIVKYKYYDFRLSNLPEGLAFDKSTGLLFQSDQRPKSMPIDDLTIRKQWVHREILSPTEYSWLHYARFGATSLQDVYGTALAPELEYGHGAISQRYNDRISYEINEPMAPLPLCFSRYKLEWAKYPVFHNFHSNLRVSPPKNQDIQFKKGWSTFELPFSKFLSNSSKTRLHALMDKFSKSVSGECFKSILRSGRTGGDFLLEEEGQNFLNKFFGWTQYESGDKSEFFRSTLGGECQYYLIWFQNVRIDDLFEAFSGAFDEFNAFLVKEDLLKDLSYPMTTFAQIASGILMKLSRDYSAKVKIIDVLRAFKLSSQNGGSLKEQMNYAVSHSALPSTALVKMERYKLAVAHPHLAKNEYDDEGAIQPAVEPAASSDPMKSFNSAVIHLSSVPTHKRASIDSYYKYYSLKEFRAADWEKDCRGGNIIGPQYLLQKDNGLDKDALGKEANKEEGATLKMTRLRELLNQARAGLSDAPYQCRPPIGIVIEDGVDLIQGFTIDQAQKNLMLLALNMVTATGVHYDPQYPTRDFPEYVAMLRILLNRFTISEPLEAAVVDWSVVYDHNRGVAEIKSTLTKTPKSQAVIDLEQAHAKAVGVFLDIHNQNPEFSFGEVMILGVISYFDPDNGDKAIKLAKSLKVTYGEFLYRALRVVLSRSEVNAGCGQEAEIFCAGGSDGNEQRLRVRAGNALEYLKFLHSSSGVAGYETVHEFLTESGEHPEHLVLLANDGEANQYGG